MPPHTYSTIILSQSTYCIGAGGGSDSEDPPSSLPAGVGVYGSSQI